jgi:hypothetical protein
VNPFQWLAVPALGALFVWELIHLLRGPGPRGPRLFRSVIWLSAAVTIAQPDLTQDLANLAGITRGTDLVLYLFVLAFLATSFYFYSRYRRLQRQVTDLVRYLALRDPHRGADQATP